MVNEEALCIAVSILAAALSTAGTGLFVVGIEKDNDVLQDIGVGLETLAIILAVWGACRGWKNWTRTVPGS